MAIAQGVGCAQTTFIPQPFMMSPEHIQRANEYTYSRKYTNKYIRFEIEKSEDLMAKIQQAVDDIYAWLKVDYYTSKNNRLEPLRAYDRTRMEELVMQMAIGCTCCQTPELFTSITAQLANKLGWDNKVASITTISELLIHLDQNDLITILKVVSGGEGARFHKESIAIQAHIPISSRLKNFIRQSSYLPPLVCEPKPVTKNSQSGHLTFNDPVTLNGWIQGHLALDTINTQNKVALTLDLEFLLNVKELPNKPLDTPKKIQAWSQMQVESTEFYLLIHGQSQGNTDMPGAIYFNHKLDLRGRMYCQGYHINYQGNPYRKAMLEFAEPRYIDVPEEYRTKSTA